MALAQVSAVSAAVSIPIVGMGGVQSGADALDLLRAGATLVAVGTESFRDPAAGLADRRRAGRSAAPGKRLLGTIDVLVGQLRPAVMQILHDSVKPLQKLTILATRLDNAQAQVEVESNLGSLTLIGSPQDV